VVALLTTVAREFERVSHHGVRVELLEQHFASCFIVTFPLPMPCEDPENQPTRGRQSSDCPARRSLQR
jgi:hypothetical protein